MGDVSCERNSANMRDIFYFCAENVEIVDWPAEGNEFELPVPVFGTV
jgi:hypothetical protein